MLLMSILLCLCVLCVSCGIEKENGYSREVVMLSDNWSFTVDSSDVGEQEKWYEDFSNLTSHTVSIPHTWNVMKGLEDYAGVAWYAKSFTTNLKENQRAYLFFEAVYRDVDVYLNGHKIYSNLNSGYLPFKVDITEHILQSGNLLVLKVSNKFSETALPYKKSFDWTNDGGVIRPVSLIKTNGNCINYANLKANISGKVYFKANFDRQTQSGDMLNLIVKDADERILLDKTYPVSVLKNEVSDSFYIDSPYLWHFDNPYLYKAEFYLKKSNGEYIDNKTTKFGFREFKIVNDSLFLNGESVRICGIEWMPGSNPLYGMAEPKEYIDSVLNSLKDINCILTRFHWPQSEYLLSRMDEMGFLVQEEIPWWQQPAVYNDTLYETHKKQIKDMIQYHYNHPSIISWGIGNEVNGQNDLVKTIFQNLKEYASKSDSSRLITFVSSTINANPRNDISSLSDVLTWNEYVGTWWNADKDELGSLINEIRNDFPNRALFITENGLCEPRFKGGDLRRISDLYFHFKEWEKHPWIVGAIYFSLNDYRSQMGKFGKGKYKQQIHGVCDMYGTPKLSYNVCKELFSPVASSEEWISDDCLLIKVQCKSLLPSYTIEKYKLEVKYKDKVEVREISKLKPGETEEFILNGSPVSYKIFRPQGCECLKKIIRPDL